MILLYLQFLGRRALQESCPAPQESRSERQELRSV